LKTGKPGRGLPFLLLKKEKNMAYMVWFTDGSAEVFFASYNEAERYARLNAGNVLDVEQWKTVIRFS
jgi:hypothetical protein